MMHHTIFDTQRKSDPLEAEYDCSTEASISSTHHKLNQHFGASISPHVSYTLSKDIKFLKSPAAQSMMEVYGRSKHKSWSNFVSHSTLNSFSRSNPQTFSVLSHFAEEYSKHIFAPLSQYDPDGQSLRGSADKLVKQIYHIHDYLKLQKIPPNCCLQLELRSVKDKSPRQVQEEKLELNRDGVKEEKENVTQHAMNDVHNNAVNQALPPFKISSDQTIDDMLRKCIDSPLNEDDNNYKRYEIIFIGSEIIIFEATSANTVPSCAYRHGHLCMTYNSTSTSAEIIDEFCNDTNTLITICFQAYHDGIKLYLYHNDVNGKLFGQRIFEHELLTILPSLFDVSTVDLQFEADEVYKQYEASLFRQNVGNEPDDEQKSSDEHHYELDPIFESKLMNIVNEINETAKVRINFAEIRQIFIENEVDLSLFETHTKSDFMALIETADSEIKRGTATKLWLRLTEGIDDFTSWQLAMEIICQKQRRIDELEMKVRQLSMYSGYNE